MSILTNYVIPQEIRGCHLRVANIQSVIRYMYSTDGSFLIPAVFELEDIGKEEFKEYLKNYSERVEYELDCPAEILDDKMKEKLFLNEQVVSEYDKVLGFDTTQILNHNNQIIVSKLFESYAIIDYNSNSVFFVVVTIFPERDAPFILQYINEVKRKFTLQGIGIHFVEPECDTKELIISNKLHLFSFSANQCIENIRTFFKKDGWRIRLVDEEYFVKKEEAKEKINNQIILCEGKNKLLFNSLKIPNVIFSDEHNSYSIFQNAKTMQRRCIRDKDFLTLEEAFKLMKKIPKYYILDFYCIENYLYHPENIYEYLNGQFNIAEYQENILHQKNKILHLIIPKIATARKSYLELKENHIIPTKEGDLIISEELKSKEFCSYYKHFDMKSFNKSYLNKYNLSDKKLASTEWLKIRIAALIDNH
jgi:hypothetical protein